MPSKNSKNIITIDASSTSSSGGGMTYLLNLIRHADEYTHIEIIASNSVLMKLDKEKNITLKTHSLLNKNKISRIIFQLFYIDKYISSESSILLSLSGDYMGSFKPNVGVCQNMLLYEEEKTIGMSFIERLKFRFLKIRQIKSFNNSNGVIFLSKFAQKKVMPLLKISNSRVINFGVSKIFFNSIPPKKKEEKICFLYVSSIHTYKNQLNLLQAFKLALKKEPHIRLKLIGPVLSDQYYKKVKNLIDEINSNHDIVEHIPNVKYEMIHKHYHESDIFIFPSICENMPNILIEAMASGKPILSSNIDPMPEFLLKNALYFNPYNINSIAKKILYSIDNYNKIHDFSHSNVMNAKNYKWQKNNKETRSFLNEIINNV